VTLVLDADVGSLFGTHALTLSQLLTRFSDGGFAPNCWVRRWLPDETGFRLEYMPRVRVIIEDLFVVFLGALVLYFLRHHVVAGCLLGMAVCSAVVHRMEDRKPLHIETKVRQATSPNQFTTD
jgi:hypothetical protein